MAEAYDDSINAMAGNVESMFLLGVRFEYGIGVPKDDAKALEWYTRAAENGDVGTQLLLAKRYSEGNRVPKDEAMARLYYTLAAEAGSPTAKMFLQKKH